MKPPPADTIYLTRLAVQEPAIVSDLRQLAVEKTSVSSEESRAFLEFDNVKKESEATGGSLELSEQGDHFTWNLTISEQFVEASISTGIKCSFLSATFVEQLGLHLTRIPITIRTGGRGVWKAVCIADVRLEIVVRDVTKEVVVEFLVINELKPKVLMGFDLIKALKFQVVPEFHTLKVSDSDLTPHWDYANVKAYVHRQ